MSIFNDDPFDDIVREFFGGRPGTRSRRRSTVIQGEDDERTSDYIEGEGYVYFIFELPGYSKEDVDVTVRNGELVVAAQKKDLSKSQEYLKQKLTRGLAIKRTLPKEVKAKKFNFTMHNGILEVTFVRK